MGKRRKVASTNIRICFGSLPPHRQAALTRAHFRWLGVALLSVGLNWNISKRRLKRLVRIRHHDMLKQARANQGNVILLAPHFLALEIGGIRLAPDYPVISMYQRIHNPVFDTVVRRGRGQYGLELVERNAPLRSLIRQIRNGRLFYYLPDQDAGRERGVFAPFCGLPASTVAAVGRMAQMTNAVVIPAITVIRPFGMGYDLHLLEPVEDFPTGDAVADATVINRVVEDGLKLAPAQYFWVHKRFKTRPEGERPVYQHR
jgi:KDO2-lipid IV(A) lauroyltransferase